MRVALLAIPLLLLMTACSKPLDTPLPSDISQLESIRPQLQKLTPDEQELFAQFLMRRTVGAALLAGLGGSGKPAPIPAGMTIGQAIEEQRQMREKFRVEEQARAARKQAEEAKQARLEAEHQKAIDRMNAAVKIELTKFTVAPEEINGVTFGQIAELRVRLTNTSAKQLSGVKWVLELRDKFGDVVGRIRLKSEKVVEAGESTEETFQSRLNQFSADDRKLAAYDVSSGKAVPIPDVVLFGDSTKLDAPSEKPGE